eukprot:11748284-Heterocapsa_arctica.AAC.1
MEPIIADEIRRVVNRLVDGRAKGVDSWSPAELRALSYSRVEGLPDILNMSRMRGWPEWMNPIIAFIPKGGAEHEGQLGPIAILPYVYRVWMAVRKRNVKQWTLELNGGRFRSPETLVWEMAARSELARVVGRQLVAAYIDCNECYGRVNRRIAVGAALKIGCDRTIVAVAFGMYRIPRIIQVHKANTGRIPVDRGIMG